MTLERLIGRCLRDFMQIIPADMLGNNKKTKEQLIREADHKGLVLCYQ